MRAGPDPLSLLVISVAGWINQRQQQLIEYLVEENRVLREQIGSRRMRFTDNQRCRLAAKAKKLGRKVLAQVATIVTPETLLASHRKLIAQKPIARESLRDSKALHSDYLGTGGRIP